MALNTTVFTTKKYVFVRDTIVFARVITVLAPVSSYTLFGCPAMTYLRYICDIHVNFLENIKDKSGTYQKTYLGHILVISKA